MIDEKQVFDDISDWYSRHGQRDDINLTFNSISVGLNKVKFYIKSTYESPDGYKIALAYCPVKGELRCRLYYKSQSESAWRASTGLRAIGGWDKGGSDLPSEGFQPGSYIGEGLLHYELEEFLEKEYSKNRRQINVAFITTINNLGIFRSKGVLNKNESYLPEAHLFLVSSPNRSHVGRIQREYLDADYGRRIYSNVLTSITKEQSKPYHKLSQVAFQESVSNKKGELSLANILKKDSIWSKITPCLNSKIGEYEFQHDAMGRDCISYIYELSSDKYHVFIEIAQTKEAMSIQHKSLDLTEVHNVVTPVCWVKNVYLSRDVSTFGNYSAYADDLWFLVQKPIDYVEQASLEKKLENVNISGITSRQGVYSGKVKKADGTVGYKVDGNKNALFSGTKYILLAFYNEKYSPLIADFKSRIGMSSFKRITKNKIRLDRFIVEEIFNKYNLPSVGFDHDAHRKVALSVVNGCAEYLGRYEQGKQGKHGGTDGKVRANALLDCTFEAIDKDFSGIENNIAKLSFDLFRTGMCNNKGKKTSIFSGINSNEGSLFGFLTNQLLANEDYIEACNAHERVREITVINNVRGYESCFSRFYARAFSTRRTLGNITDNDRADLLRAFLGER